MAFSNTRDGQGNRTENYSKSEYKPRRNNDNQGYKPRTNQGSKDEKGRDFRGKDYQKKDFKGDSGKFRQSSNQGKDFKNSYRDGGKNEGFRSKSSGNDKEPKVKEQQPDKFEIINRLEKEKKVMKKKSDTSNRKAKGQNAKPQVKVKRTNNIDWTKEYENDSFDDDDTFYDY